jgi:hypothetical protein
LTTGPRHQEVELYVAELQSGAVRSPVRSLGSWRGQAHLWEAGGAESAERDAEGDDPNGKDLSHEIQARAAEELLETELRRRPPDIEQAKEQPAGTVRLSDDPARAKEIRKEQKEALIAGVACLEGRAVIASIWFACGLSKKAIMQAIQDLRRASRGSVKCGWENIIIQR